MRLVRLLLALLLVCLSAASAGAQTLFVQTQSGNTANSSVTGLAATAVTKTLAATSSGARAHLYSFSAFCSAGTSTVTVTDGGVQIWTSSAGWVPTTLISASWIPGLTGGFGKTMVITLASCGGGNTGTLNVQADIF
jgi:TRAP-type C4-dicarboxylate transport system substrate-binding protein